MKRLLSCLALVLLATAAAAAPASQHALTLPIAGHFTDAAGGQGTFAGTFKLTDFAVSGNQIVADGYVSGTLTDSLGNSLGTTTKAVSLPVSFGSAAGAIHSAAFAAATCDILHLTLGPLDLDLLGLRIHLNRIVLDITAQSGSGNLLGNLLCAVTHLLDTGGSLGDLADLLDRILDILSSLLG